MKSQVILIDAKNFVYRHHHTHRNLSSHGFPTSVLYGCPIALLTLAKRFPGAPLVFIWDGCKPTWRHSMLSKAAPKVPEKGVEAPKAYAYMQASQAFLNKIAPKPVIKTPPPVKKEKKIGYKANRDKIHAQFDDARRQIPMFRTFLDHLGIRQFEIDYLEGDDLMGILTTWIEKHEIFDEVIIHSSDRDFYQFISDRVRVLRSTKEGGFAKPSDIEQEFGVAPGDHTKLKAITGEHTDNIPHLFPGVGPKTSAKWLSLGLDPSLPTWQAHSGRVRKQLVDIDAKYRLEARWKEIHTNYIVSQIVRTADDKLLPERVQIDLERLLSKVSKGYLRADTRCKTQETWRWLTDFLAKYEMNELFARRTELWKLP